MPIDDPPYHEHEDDELLTAYLNGTLPESARAEVDERLADDPVLRAHLAELMLVHTILDVMLPRSRGRDDGDAERHATISSMIGAFETDGREPPVDEDRALCRRPGRSWSVARFVASFSAPIAAAVLVVALVLVLRNGSREPAGPAASGRSLASASERFVRPLRQVPRAAPAGREEPDRSWLETQAASHGHEAVAAVAAADPDLWRSARNGLARAREGADAGLAATVILAYAHRESTAGCKKGLYRFAASALGASSAPLVMAIAEREPDVEVAAEGYRIVCAEGFADERCLLDIAVASIGSGRDLVSVRILERLCVHPTEASVGALRRIWARRDEVPGDVLRDLVMLVENHRSVIPSFKQDLAHIGSEHAHPLARASALACLVRLGEGQYLDALCDEAKDDIPSARFEVATTLKRFGDVRHLPVAESLARDPEPDVARFANEALNAIRSRANSPPR